MVTRLLCLLLLAGCGDGFADPERAFAPPVAAASLHPVVVHPPRGAGVLDAGGVDAAGDPLGPRCATCHEGVVRPDGNPERMHADLVFAHGDLSCDACHGADRLGLELADGTALDFGDALRLCAQCHGPQTRDYRRGSHGGMRGYWDLRRGPRERNHCLDCHGAHAPAFVGGAPVAAPVDRGLHPSHTEGAPDVH